MIEVTITYHARKELVNDKQVQMMPAFVKFWDNKTFFVAADDMADLIQLCAKRGWEISHKPVFPTTFSKIKRQCEAAAMPEHQEQP